MNRIEVEKKVLNENQILAEQLRDRYRQNNVLCVNLISSPGSGKTALLERTLERMDRAGELAPADNDPIAAAVSVDRCARAAALDLLQSLTLVN